MKYFGTDGFRGKVNYTLDALQAFKVGACLGNALYNKHGKKNVYVGMDTRLSSSMLEAGVASGLASMGMDVKLLGVVPTPVVSYITANSDAVGAVMISASHNPYYDNGIKLFSELGEKMDPDTEEYIERYLDNEFELEWVNGDNLGVIVNDDENTIHAYMDYLKENLSMDLSGLKIVLDCANGASVSTAKKAFELFGGEVVVMNDQPDGYNINTKCGSTHPEQLVQKVLELNADAGFAFDGDADRCIGVNHLGDLVTGDDVLYLVGKYLKKNNKLKNNLVVTTVMANLGLFRALEREGIDYRSTQVGDKYVFEVLGQEDGVIGGEQSGHIIFKDIAHTGDGVLTALKLVEIMVHENKSLKELTNGLVIYPQTLKNLKVKDKQVVLEDSSVNDLIAEIETRLNKDGRILVRPSGTEPLIRVMVEAKDQLTCDSIVDEVIDYIVQRGY